MVLIISISIFLSGVGISALILKAQYDSPISEMTVEQSKSIKNVQEFMDKIISKAKVNSEKSEKMTTDIEEQMSEFEEINTISNELENMAVNLTALVNEFKI